MLFEWVREANRRLDAGERVGAGPAAARCCTRFGLESLLEAATRRRRAEAERLLAEREEARAARDFERADRLRDELAERGWEVRDTAEGPRLVRRDVIVYGRNPVREALRGRRRSSASAPPRRLRGVAGGRRRERRRAPRSSELCGSPDHQGVCAEVGPTRTRTPTRCSSAEDALVVCLDEVQDPHNLGAVCRVAEAAGAPAW